MGLPYSSLLYRAFAALLRKLSVQFGTDQHSEARPVEPDHQPYHRSQNTIRLVQMGKSSEVKAEAIGKQYPAGNRQDSPRKGRPKPLLNVRSQEVKGLNRQNGEADRNGPMYGGPNHAPDSGQTKASRQPIAKVRADDHHS